MSRYIDADKLIAEYDRVHIGPAGGARKLMEDAPTADVVEVKHGEWIYHECVSSYEGAISGYSCSECCIFVDEEIFDADSFHKDFCGNCGAKMDGGNQ